MPTKLTGIGATGLPETAGDTGTLVTDGSLVLGNADTDNITVNAEFNSHLSPDEDNTYDLGEANKRWRKGYFNEITGGTNIVSLTGTVTVGDVHHTILMGAGNVATTCNLPAAASCRGRIYIFKKIGSDATSCEIAGDDGEDIDDNTDQALNKRYDTMTIQSDGTQWWILNELHYG